MKTSLLPVLGAVVFSVVGATAKPAAHESANMVGYSEVPLRQGYNMLALNFEGIGARGLTLDDIFPGKTPNLTAGTSETADQVLVYSGDKYASYYLYYSSNHLQHLNYRWVSEGPVLCTNRFRTGDAFWFNKRGSAPATVTIAGQVPSDAGKSHEIRAGFNMLGSSYAAAWDPNELGAACWATNGAVHGNSLVTADQIVTFAGGKQTVYFLWYSPTDATALNNQWVSLPGPVKAPAGFVRMSTGVGYTHRGSGFALPQIVPPAAVLR
jgi:hypothetical protein